MTKQIKLDKKTIASLAERGRNSLFFLARGILGFDDLTAHIHKPLCEELEKFEENTRMGVELPRDWFKSTLGSIAYPIWRAIRNHDVRILVVQNSMANARKKILAIKQIFEKNDLFRALYPEILPTKSSTWTQECLTVNRKEAHPEGTFEAAGVGTAITSRHYDLIVQDDTISPGKDAMTGVAQQPTQLEIEKAIGFHRLTHPLLLHPSKSQLLVIGTRWAVGDLIGWIKKNAPHFKWFSRKARDESGKPIWDRYDEKVLCELELELGPYMFAALFLNDPTEAINQVFRRDWIRYYQNMPRTGLVYCTSIDPASAKREESAEPDYSVVLTTAMKVETGDIFVVDYTRERMNPGQHIDAIFDHWHRYHSVVFKLDAIAYQRTLGYWLRRRMDKTKTQFYIEEVKSLTTSKVDRIRGLQPYFANGKIAIRATMPELERELLAFPKGVHDDLIDCLAMQRDFWNECLAAQEEEVKKEERNPFSGATILDELKERAKKPDTYPYDVGNMADSIRDLQLRDYSYA